MDYFERKLDAKNRLTVPKELQQEFASGVVITRGFGQYLHLYSQAVWNQDMESALTGNILDEKTADLNVAFRTGKISAALDKKQGRITLEPHHLKYAKIKSGITAVRAGKYFRISAS